MVYELYAWYSWLFAVTKLQRLANEWEEKAKKTKELRRGKEMNAGSNNCSYMHLYGSRCTRKSICNQNGNRTTACDRVLVRTHCIREVGAAHCCLPCLYLIA